MTSSTPKVPPLKVPQRHVRGFETLRSMEDVDFLALLGAFASVEAVVQGEALAKSIQQESQQDPSAVTTILDAIMSLAALSYRTRESSSFVAERVAGSAQFPSDDGLELRFATRIRRLIECEVIRLQSKALAIGSTHERVFANAQLVTDLRPLFDEDLDRNPGPEAALLSHTLNLHYIASDGRHDNFYIALDDDDISTLRQALDRAILKVQSLNALLEDSGILRIKSTE